jgi:hypothetical protein
MGTLSSGETKVCIFTSRFKVMHCELNENSAYVCRRPLKGMPLGYMGPNFAPQVTFGTYHRHIFFGRKIIIPLLGDKEWDNIGFGADKEKPLFEESNKNGYECEDNQYDIRKIIKAIEFTLVKNGYREGNEYDLFTKNCQDFVADVLEAYRFPMGYLENKTRVPYVK